MELDILLMDLVSLCCIILMAWIVYEKLKD